MLSSAKTDTRPSLKVLLLGSSKDAAKKKEIASLLRDEQHSFNGIGTIGIDFFYSSNNDLKLQVWDLAGQDRYKDISPSYLKGANIVLLCPDDEEHLAALLFKKAKLEKTESSVRFYVVANPILKASEFLEKEIVLTLDKNLKEELLKKSQHVFNGIQSFKKIPTFIKSKSMEETKIHHEVEPKKFSIFRNS